MKRRHRAIGSPTKAEQAHQDAQRDGGCAACHLRRNRQQPNATEIHHRTTGDLHGQKQLGHDCTVALCAWHHRGECRPGMTVDAMRDAFGPSLAHHKRDFIEWIQDTLGARSTAAMQAWQDKRIQRSNAA